MQLFKKTAALILAAAISFASVSAVAYADESGISAIDKVELTLEGSSKPSKTTLKVTATRSGYKFSWKKVSGIKAYEIYCSKDNGKTYERIATVESNKTSKTINTLDISKKYMFRIRSYKTSGKKKVYSKFSNIVTIRPVTEAATVDLAKASESNTSPKTASKQLSLVTVPVSKINSNLAYVTDYLGQDLYVIKEKGSEKKQVYKVTKSALRSYKTTGKLKADKIKLDRSLDGIEWYVYSTQLEKCNSTVICYINSDGKLTYTQLLYDEGSKTLKSVHTTNNRVGSLTSEGYLFEIYWTERTTGTKDYRDANIEVYAPDGSRYKHLIYEEEIDYYSRWFCESADDGVWYSYAGAGYSRTVFIDRKGNETKVSPGGTIGIFGSSKYLVYYPTTTESGYNAKVADYKLYLKSNDKTYKFSDFDVITIGADVDYDLKRLSGIKKTTAVGAYKYSTSDDPYESGKYKYSLIDIASGKLLTPVYDDMYYNSSTGTYLAFTFDTNDNVTGAWYYSNKGKNLAKFDDGSIFTKDGYTLVSIGKELFFINKNFERVSSNLKFNKSKGWENVNGNKGVMAYSSNDTGYFIVYA